MPATPGDRKHSPVGQHRTSLRAVIATLCAALAVVFAGASAASVLDRVQHEAQLQHEHGLHLSFAADPGHHDHEAETSGGDREHDGGNAGDHQPGIGHHHHSDAPSGALSGLGDVQPLVIAVNDGFSAGEATPAKGVAPGGLKRPPRTPNIAD